MRGWDSDELRKIAEADDLHVSPGREDVCYATFRTSEQVGPQRQASQERT
jgi:hypothetical protein